MSEKKIHVWESRDKRVFNIIVGRKMDDGIFYEVVWYSEKHNQMLNTQSKEPNYPKEDELKKDFSLNESYEVIKKMELNKNYDYVVMVMQSSLDEFITFNDEVEK